MCLWVYANLILRAIIVIDITKSRLNETTTGPWTVIFPCPRGVCGVPVEQSCVCDLPGQRRVSNFMRVQKTPFFRWHVASEASRCGRPPSWTPPAILVWISSIFHLKQSRGLMRLCSLAGLGCSTEPPDFFCLVQEPKRGACYVGEYAAFGS